MSSLTGPSIWLEDIVWLLRTQSPFAGIPCASEEPELSILELFFRELLNACSVEVQ